jgi:REP element-mobilizing transposase RayT
LPIEVLQRLAEEKQRLSKELPRAGESRRERALRVGKRLFALVDNALDTSRSGPKWLTDNAVAEILIENLFYHAEQLFRLWAFVVMPNHVHLLIEPLTISKDLGNELNDDDFIAVSRITHALKSYTAKRANLALNREGTFWQEESYDHWIRDEKEFSRVILYIENNPVKAGLVNSPEKWRWSSAAFERGDDGACVNRREI